MKRLIFCLILLVFGMIAITAKAQSLSEARDKGDYVAYKNALIKMVESRAQDGFNPDDGTLVHALALLELLRSTGIEHINEFAATEDGKEFLKVFLSNREWVAAYISNGPIPSNTSAGLRTLANIYKTDPDAATSRYIPLATAVALVYHSGCSDRAAQGVPPVERYMFYKKSHVEGKLHSSFDKLSVAHLRWVVIVQYSNRDLEWLQDNVSVPITEIHSVCWIPRYRGVNDFGNTVQGPLYNVPARAKVSHMENTAVNGGVCGAMSHFGATYAQARGIPATPKGQPGHCAYAYRVAPNEWTPSFGGPDGGSLYDFWRDSFAYTWMADDLFTDAEKTALATRYFWYARTVHELSGLKKAFPHYLEAMAIQPLHYGIYHALIKTADADQSGDMGEKEWKELAQRVQTGMKKHPMPMCDLLAMFDEKHLMPNLKPKQGIAYLISLNKTVAHNLRPGWTPWNPAHAALAKYIGKLDPKNQIIFYRDVLSCYVEAKHDFMIGEVMAWGTNHFASREDELTDAIIEAFSGGKKGKDVDQNLRQRIFQQAIRASEASKSIATFHKLNEVGYGKKPKTTADNFPRPSKGKLLSDKGMIYFGGTDNYDNPLTHFGMLTENGGGFHGPGKVNGKNNFAVVILPEAKTISGITVVNTDSNKGRCTGLAILVSDDEQTWREIGRAESFSNGHTFDFSDQRITSRLIKVEKISPEDTVFHLKNICVYGN